MLSYRILPPTATHPALVEYYLEGVMIYRGLQAGAPGSHMIPVMLSLRRFAPRYAPFPMAKALWEARMEIPPTHPQE